MECFAQYFRLIELLVIQNLFDIIIEQFALKYFLVVLIKVRQQMLRFDERSALGLNFFKIARNVLRLNLCRLVSLRLLSLHRCSRCFKIKI